MIPLKHRHQLFNWHNSFDPLQDVKGL